MSSRICSYTSVCAASNSSSSVSPVPFSAASSSRSTCSAIWRGRLTSQLAPSCTYSRKRRLAARVRPEKSVLYCSTSLYRSKASRQRCRCAKRANAVMLSPEVKLVRRTSSICEFAFAAASVKLALSLCLRIASSPSCGLAMAQFPTNEDACPSLLGRVNFAGFDVIPNWM